MMQIFLWKKNPLEINKTKEMVSRLLCARTFNETEQEKNTI